MTTRVRQPQLNAAGATAYTITADAGSYTLIGTDAVVLHAWKVDATGAGSYAYTGTDATTREGFAVDAKTAGSYVLTGTDAATTHQWKLDATTAGSYALTGTDANPTKVTGKFVTAESGVYALIGTDVTLTKTTNKILIVDPGAYLLTGTDATLTKGSNNKSLTVDSGSYLLVGTEATLRSSAQPVLPLRGEWPIKKRKRQPEYHAALRARDALREALERLYDGGDYNAPIEALEEAQGEAQSVVNVLSRLPDVPLAQLQAAEDLMRQIAEIIRLRLLDEAQTEAATEIARIHLNETIDLATALYRQTRYDYLARVALLTAE